MRLLAILICFTIACGLVAVDTPASSIRYVPSGSAAARTPSAPTADSPQSRMASATV